VPKIDVKDEVKK